MSHPGQTSGLPARDKTSIGGEIYCHGGDKRHQTTDAFALFYIRLPQVLNLTGTVVDFGKQKN